MNRDRMTLETMRTAPKGTICQVRNLSTSTRIEFTSDSQDVQFLRDYFGQIASDYNSFFFVLDESGCDYAQVWGMFGIVPIDTKSLTKVF